MTSANDNATYNLSELGWTRVAVTVVGKWIKAFKKRHEAELDLEVEGEDVDNHGEPDKDLTSDGSEEDK